MLTCKLIQLVQLGLGVEFGFFSAVWPAFKSAQSSSWIAIKHTSKSTDLAADGDV
jgi:hypothetical protein